MKQYQSQFITSAFLLMLCFLLSGVATAADKSNERILFLTLQFDNTSVNLVNSRIVPGHLKTNRGAVTGDIEYELKSDSALLLQGAIENPLVRRFEYEDPDNAGKLKTKVVTSPSATITLRVPYSTAIKQLTFYRVTPSAGTGSKSTRAVRGTIDLTSVHISEKPERGEQ